MINLYKNEFYIISEALFVYKLIVWFISLLRHFFFLKIGSKYIFNKKIKLWNVNNNCGLVFGATKKEELLSDIKLFGDLPVLLPGVGAQGGSIEDIVNIFKQNGSSEFLINISRGIIYRSSEEDFADQARVELEAMNEIITSIMSN